MSFPYVSVGSPLGLLSTVVLVAVSATIYKYLTNLQAVSYFPGARLLFTPLTPLGFILPPSRWNLGGKFVWNDRFTAYKNTDTDTFSVVAALFGNPTFYTSNLEVAKQVTLGGHKSDFIKCPAAGSSLGKWGMNLLSVESEIWRKHRRIIGSAFNSRLHDFVWTETSAIYDDMMTSEGWIHKKEVEVPVMQRLTTKVALLAIVRCGFGLSFTWKEPPKAEDADMSIQDAIRIFADEMMLTAVTPTWVWQLPFKRFQKLGKAYSTMMEFMRSNITHRRAQIQEAKDGSDETFHDALSLMIKSNEAHEIKLRLDDQELIGNTFLLLFAGHESTAQTIATTLGLLSIHPDIQQELVDHIAEVVGSHDLKLEHYSQLFKVLGAFYETVRMYPAGWVAMREAQRDTVLRVPMRDGQPDKLVAISKGTHVIVDMVGLHYNPRYISEPEKFKPERWHTSTEASVAEFTAFGIGPRECVGRRFASTEAVCFLTRMLRDLKVEPWLRNGESVAEWKGRCLNKVELGLTLSCLNLPLRFTRRN